MFGDAGLPDLDHLIWRQVNLGCSRAAASRFLFFCTTTPLHDYHVSTTLHISIELRYPGRCSSILVWTGWERLFIVCRSQLDSSDT
jgi:hypothetical protein